jgi:hypothetical protein
MQRQSRRFDNYRKGIHLKNFPPQAAVDALTLAIQCYPHAGPDHSTNPHLWCISVIQKGLLRQ